MALVALNATLYTCRKCFGVRRVPIVSSYVPHHRRQAKFPRGAQHIRPAGAERWSKIFHCFTGRILNRSATACKLFPDARGPLPHQRGMAHGVVSHQVAGLPNRAGDIRTPSYEVAYQEEDRPRLVVGQQIEQLYGVWIVGTVIEGEGKFMDIRTGKHGAPENLRSGPLRGISIGPRS